MRQVSLIGLVSIVALFTGGCLGGQEEQQATQGTPSPQAAAPVRPPRPSPAATPFQSKPLVAQQPGTNSAVAGLIQPELPENVRIPQGQRSDPFSAVPVQPEVTVSPNPVAAGGNGTRPVPVVPPLQTVPPRPQIPGVPQSSRREMTPARPVPNLTKLPSPPKGAGKAPSSSRSQPNRSQPSRSQPNRSQPNRSQPNRSQPSTIATRLPSPQAGPTAVIPPRALPQLPNLPEPTQARGVEVTGVVEVGGVPMAIVKVPNEPARYVREGQRIANGQVLVKRIEMNRGPEPVVILEQYGIEVARGVGEAPATSPGGPGQPPPPPTASLPSAPSPLLNIKVSSQAG